MNREELKTFFTDWADAFRTERKGMYLLNSYIWVEPTDKWPYGDCKTELFVYAYDHNKILIGRFEPNNGCIRDNNGFVEAYSPTIKFINELNVTSGTFGRGYVSIPNNPSIPFDDELVVNEENLLKCVRDSWSYLKLFEDKPI